MRVLQLSKYYPPYHGGIENMVFNLTEDLNASGINTDVLCCNNGNETIIDEFNSYKVIRAGRFLEVASTCLSPQLISELKNRINQYDILHLHHPNPMANLALYLSGFKGKVVLHWHSDIIRQTFILKIYHPLLDWMLKRSDSIIATSDNYANSSEYLLRYKDKVSVIPIGLNLKTMPVASDKLVAEIKETYNGKKIVFSLGRLVYYKGFEFLIRAARALPEDSVVVIGGEGKLKATLQGIIRKEGLERKVFLIGSIAQLKLASYYQACSLFVLPSIERSEAFGIVQLEAMFYKKPLISTNIKGSGVNFINNDGKTGFLVSPRDVSSLSAKINTLLDNAELSSEMGENSFKRLKENFDTSALTTKYISLYNGLLGT